VPPPARKPTPSNVAALVVLEMTVAPAREGDTGADINTNPRPYCGAADTSADRQPASAAVQVMPFCASGTATAMAATGSS